MKSRVVKMVEHEYGQPNLGWPILMSGSRRRMTSKYDALPGLSLANLIAKLLTLKVHNLLWMLP
jgi:hypothetical protein